MNFIIKKVVHASNTGYMAGCGACHCNHGSQSHQTKKQPITCLWCIAGRHTEFCIK